LSKRETQVLIGLGEGRDTAEISATLRVNRNTVQSYAARLKKKLGLKTHSQLVRTAALLREGILPLDDNKNHSSIRICPRCKTEFEAPDVKEETCALAGYQALAVVLKAR
jgi:DNA-binding CsgD family transcriptional regulator